MFAKFYQNIRFCNFFNFANLTFLHIFHFAFSILQIIRGLTKKADRLPLYTKNLLFLQVVGLARRGDRLEQLANRLLSKNGEFYAFQADITKEEDIIKAFTWTKQTVGPVHILVNNAGVAKFGTISNTKTDDAQNILNLNVLAVTLACREAIKIFKEHNIRGHVININSLAGHKIVENLAVYCASKHAVTALTKMLNADMRSQKTGTKVTVSI